MSRQLSFLRVLLERYVHPISTVQLTHSCVHAPSHPCSHLHGCHNDDSNCSYKTMMYVYVQVCSHGHSMTMTSMCESGWLPPLPVSLERCVRSISWPTHSLTCTCITMSTWGVVHADGVYQKVRMFYLLANLLTHTYMHSQDYLGCCQCGCLSKYAYVPSPSQLAHSCICIVKITIRKNHFAI